MNRYFVSLTLVQGIVIGWLVAAIVNMIAPVTTMAGNVAGLAATCAFFVILYNVVADH